MNISPENNQAIGYLRDYDPGIIVMMPVKNAKNVITQSLCSLANQAGVTRKMLVLISDDHSQEHWENGVPVHVVISAQKPDRFGGKKHYFFNTIP